MGSRSYLIAMVCMLATSGTWAQSNQAAVEKMQQQAIDKANANAADWLTKREQTVQDNLAKRGIVEERFVKCMMASGNAQAVKDCEADRDQMIELLGNVSPKSPESMPRPDALKK